MRIDIDTARCEGHGLCAQVAPQVFDLDDDDLVILRQVGQIPADLEAAAASGARSCPVAALSTSS
jgi:ferredoxin